uniref:Uncharacterized protein n=1 Tax=Anopheles dirus TaxID=7168 RepID=A0A182ND85_9DIPT
MHKKNRLTRAKELLRLAESDELPSLVFSDEKPFVIQQFVNKLNDRVYLPERSAENLQLRLATRTQKLAMVLVWAAITAEGRSPLVSSTHHRTQHAPLKNGYEMRSLALFPPHYGHQNHQMPIRWTIVLEVFWKVRLALKNTKVSISSSKRCAENGP